VSLNNYYFDGFTG